MGNVSAQLLWDTIIEHPEKHGYAFAAWRLPKETHQQFILSLDPPTQVTSTPSSLDTGFVVNRFDSKHPSKPYFIPADVRFNQEFIFDPRVSSSKIDSFYERIENGTKSTASVPFKGAVRANEYEKNVSMAIEAIRGGEMEKVVLSRYKDISLPEGFSIRAYFDKLCSAYPNAFCSLVYLPNEGIWIGASPEIIIQNTPDTFKTVSLAGTKKIADKSLSEISWTQKEIEEQAFVSRYIINCFKKLRLREFEEYGPKTIKAGTLAHLKTEFSVDLNETGFYDLADNMLDLLHPTSAVCGMPLDKASSFIKKHEKFDRSFFSGYLGPVNFKDATQLFVNLRCMNIHNQTARLYAGAGITEDSDPHAEYLETEMKMGTLLNLFSF